MRRKEFEMRNGFREKNEEREMKRNEICYVAIVAIIGASLLLGFAEEVFHTDLGGLKWAAHWVFCKLL